MLKLIAAIDKNFILGMNNTIPWYYPEDLKRFKKETADSILIMGKNTLLSLPKKLSNRITIGISSTIKEHSFSDLIVDSYNKAVREAFIIQSKTFKNIWIAGGANVYKQALKDKRVDYLDITFVPTVEINKENNVVYFDNESLKNFSLVNEFINEKDERITHKIFRRNKEITND